MSSAAIRVQNPAHWPRCNSVGRDATEGRNATEGVPYSAPASRWAVFAVAALICLTFFLTEHSLDISTVDAYTQTADEMEISAAGGRWPRR
jgi:hypothetical protein